MGNKYLRSFAAGIFLMGAGAVVASCADDQIEDDAVEDGSVRGELLIYSIDQLDGDNRTEFFLRTADQVEHPLFFDVEPDLAPGTRIKVWGPRQGDGFRVKTMQPLASKEVENVKSALINGMAYPPRTFAFVLVDTGAGVNTTKDEVLNLLLNNPGSVKSYYKYASFGRQDVTAEVFGPIRYTMTGCNTSKMSTDLRAMIPGQFQHYLWYLGSRNASCGWAGLASVGTPDRPSRDTWYNASTGCVVLVQEPGHNFGMAHSSSMTCGTAAPFVDDPMTTCRHSEYGDRFDPMGGGCRHMNAWQKAYQGWYGGCNGVKVASSATFTLLSNGKACNGAQFLQIPAPKVRMMPRSGGGGSASVDTLSHYYVEFRAPDNFDGTLGWRNMPQSALAPQVQIRIGGELRGRTQRGLHTWVLDMTPATPTALDQSLAVGKSYVDPAGGLTITVMAADANSATVKVEMTGAGANTCLDGTTFMAPGPGPESCSAIGGGSDGGVIGGGDAGVPMTGSGGAGGRADAGGGAGGVAGGTGGSGGNEFMPKPDGSAPVVDAKTGGPDTSPVGPGINNQGTVEGGCGCRTAPGSASLGGLGAIGLALLGLRRRRRV